MRSLLEPERLLFFSDGGFVYPVFRRDGEGLTVLSGRGAPLLAHGFRPGLSLPLLLVEEVCGLQPFDGHVQVLGDDPVSRGDLPDPDPHRQPDPLLLDGGDLHLRLEDREAGAGQVGGGPPDVWMVEEALDGGMPGRPDVGQDQGMVVRGGKRDLLRPREVGGSS